MIHAVLGNYQYRVLVHYLSLVFRATASVVAIVLTLNGRVTIMAAYSLYNMKLYGIIQRNSSHTLLKITNSAAVSLCASNNWPWPSLVLALGVLFWLLNPSGMKA